MVWSRAVSEETQGRRWTVGDLRNLELHLGKLIRNAGISPRQLEIDRQDLLRLVGTVDATSVYEWIVSALRDMERDQYTDALMNAFGIGYSKAPKLTDRRMEWANHRDDPVSEDTVRRWEKKALHALALKLTQTPLPTGPVNTYPLGHPAVDDMSEIAGIIRRGSELGMTDSETLTLVKAKLRDVGLLS